jgi:hypothetical protein
MSPQEIEQRLQTPVTVDFKEMTFKEAIDELGERTGLHFVVDLPALDEEGISGERPISLVLEGVSAKSTLNLLLHQLHLSWDVKDGAVFVTTAKRKSHTVIERTYPIEDLLMPNGTDGRRCWNYGLSAEFRDWFMRFFTNNIAPTSWSEAGGPGLIAFGDDGTSLVVTQTPDVQEEVQDLLDAVRRLGSFERLFHELQLMKCATPPDPMMSVDH